MIRVSEELVSEERERGPAGVERSPLESQHASLRLHGERIEELLDGLAEGGSDTRSASEALRLLDHFRRMVLDHLAFEEREGILDRAASAAPRFSRRVEGLRCQHAELRALLQCLADGPAAQPGFVELHAGFVAFRTRLLVHEQAENDVMARAYLEDLGGGD